MAPDDFLTFQRKEKERKKKQREEEERSRRKDREKEENKRFADPEDSKNPVEFFGSGSDKPLEEYNEADLFFDTVDITLDLMELEETAGLSLFGDAANPSGLLKNNLFTDAANSSEPLKSNLFTDGLEAAKENLFASAEEEPDEKVNLFSAIFGGEEAEDDKEYGNSLDERIREATDKIFKAASGELSGKEMLQQFADMEDADSPFKKLYDKIKDSDGVDADSADAMKDFMTDVKDFMLKEVKEEMERRKEMDESEDDLDPAEIRRRESFDSKMDLRMSLLKKTMGDSEFQDLCDDINDLGYGVDMVGNPILTMLGLEQTKVKCGLYKLQEIAEEGGETPGFFKMFNSAKSFVMAEEGPEASSASKNLATDAASYVLNDCAPGKQGVNQDTFSTAMYLLGSILPDGVFKNFVNQVNQQPGRGITYAAEDFLNPPELKAPEAARALDLGAPVLRALQPWEA